MVASCEDLRRVGGVDRRLWIFNISTVDDTVGDSGFTIDGNGYVTAIAWGIYGGLWKFESQKRSHSGGYTGVIQPGGNKFFNHDVIAKLFNATPADDDVIEELSTANVGIILETNNKEFLIYGGYNGMEMIEATQNSGAEAESDTTSTLTFQGQERSLPLRFFTTDYATSVALLESYEL